MGSKSKKTTSKTTLPSWINDASEKAVGIGSRIADRQHESFAGDRVAGLSTNEQLASERARTGFGSATDYFKSGAKALGGVQSWTGADHGAFMNPYVQNVVDKQMRGVNRQFSAKQADLARTSAQRTAFGGGRQTALEGALNRDQLETTGDIYGTGYAAAYDNAQRTHADEQQRKIAEAGAFASLGSGTGALAGTEIDALSRTGKEERTIDQMQKDFDYSQFIEKRDWDVNNLAPLLASISQAKHDTTQTTKEKTSGGALSQMVGLAATVAGAYFTGGASLALGGAAGAVGGGAVNSVAGATSSAGMLGSLSGSWTGAAFPTG